MSGRMSDFGAYDRGRRRKKRGGRRDAEFDSPTPAVVSRPTFILAKPPAAERDRLSASSDEPNSELSRPLSALSPSLAAPPPGLMDKPVLMLKTREESRPVSISGGAQSIPSLLATEDISHSPTMSQQQQLQQRPMPGSEGGIHLRVAPSCEMTHSVKLVDDSFNWCDSGMEMLQDQTDFFTIGVIGTQGVGKSTILSMLAGNSQSDPHRLYAFRPQGKEACGMCTHQTVGVDMMVTPERMVLLDTQPILSASVLDHVIQHDKKYPAEFITAENCVEMQSLQVTSFLMTVCNVVVIVLDWFADSNVLRFLQTAEMLKPATPPPSHENSDDVMEYYPQIVFVLNKAQHEDFSTENYNLYNSLLSTTLEDSKLCYTGPVSLADGRLIPGLNPRTVKGKVNLFLLSDMDGDNRNENGGVMSLMPEYRGHPSFEELMRCFRNQLFSMPRLWLTHTVLSEKNWFHYAARTWETVKKSALFSEYNRLLP